MKLLVHWSFAGVTKPRSQTNLKLTPPTLYATQHCLGLIYPEEKGQRNLTSQKTWVNR